MRRGTKRRRREIKKTIGNKSKKEERVIEEE